MFYPKQFNLLRMGFLASVAIPVLVAGTSNITPGARAQDASPSPAPTFALPTSLPSDVAVSLDGSNSMKGVTQALVKQFETKFPNNKVATKDIDADAALAAVEKGEANVAAIGRALTTEEKAQGLNYVPLKREKIAIVVGESNPFQGDITFDQFAKIFRGEITDWSQLGGKAGPIRLIDRPETSDTRRSFKNYPVFQSAPFEAGQTAQPLSEDSTNAMIKELGSDGIGYATVSHVLNRPGIRIISMHKTLPDDPRYPFSQSRGYAYKDASNPAVQALLGVATSPEGQQAAEAALATDATAEGGVAGANSTASGTASEASPATGAASTAEAKGGGFPWLPLLLGAGAVAAGGLLWGALRGKKREEPEEVVGGSVQGQPVAGLGAIATGAGAAAGAAAAGLGTAARTGLEEATDLGTRATTTATDFGKGVLGVGAAAAGVGAAAVGLGALGAKAKKGRAVLVPRSEETAYAYWEIPDAQKADCRIEGGRTMGARLYDVTEGNDAAAARLVNQVDCDDSDCDRHLAIPEGNRDYLVDVGYTTADNRWLSMARSEKVHVPATGRESWTAGIGGLGLAAGGAAVAAGATALSAASRRPSTTQESRIILVPRNSQQAYAYWEVPEDHKVELHRQGGKTPKLRLHDVTYQPNQVPNETNAPVQEITISEHDQDQHLRIPVSGRNYVAELGYETTDGRWLSMARSTATHIPYDWAATGIGGTGRDPQDTASADSKTILEVPSESNFPASTSSLSSTAAESVPPVTPESKTILEVPDVLSPVTGAVAAAGAAAMGVGMAASASAKTILDRSEEPTIARPHVDQQENTCSVQSLSVHSRQHCYQLSADMVQQMQDKGVKQRLEPGHYLIKIRSGGFGYSAQRKTHEPWVMLWLYGGRVLNQQTGVNVTTTMTTLNGYDEVLPLQVIEPSTLSAFFVDTHIDDNEGEVKLSIVQLD